MLCWICLERPASSREHIVKASDLRLTLGRDPNGLFVHTETRKNRKVQSINSIVMKYPPSICDYCNTTRTQANDRAWEFLSQYIYNRVPRVRKGTILNLNKVFSGPASVGLRNVHLYFVKLFGCLISYSQAPIDLTLFRKAILDQTNHPDVWIEVIESEGIEEFQEAGRSPLNLAYTENTTHCANWLYHVHRYSILVSYLPYGRAMPLGHYPIHPSYPRKLVRVGRLQP